MNPHYSEADLLETYYTRPGESMPVMMHLADCAECAERYERLERKLRGLQDADPPDAFFDAQRGSIASRIAAHRAGHLSAGRISRIAAAAGLVLVLGGVVTWRQIDDAVPPVTRTAAVATAATTATPLPASDDPAGTTAADPWESDELKDFQSIVAWESWVQNGTRTGDQSL